MHESKSQVSHQHIANKVFLLLLLVEFERLQSWTIIEARRFHISIIHSGSDEHHDQFERKSDDIVEELSIHFEEDGEKILLVFIDQVKFDESGYSPES